MVNKTWSRKKASMVGYDILEQFRDPLIYDLQCDAFDEDVPCIEEWARTTGGPLLDIACGTGRMAIHLALSGYQVSGLDIVPEMINRARLKATDREVSIEWLVADARTFHLGKCFPFVFMLMNAFQFLLIRADQEALFARVREHLLPGGYFLFETRNPSRQNLEDLRHPDGAVYLLPDGGELRITEQQQYDPITQIQHYAYHHKFHHPDGIQLEKTQRTALRYVFPQEMEALLFYNGFQIHTCYGNWQQDPLTATTSSMIYICQKLF